MRYSFIALCILLVLAGCAPSAPDAIVQWGSVDVVRSGASMQAPTGGLLQQGDTVHANDYAAIVFFGASVMRLEPGATVELTSLDRDAAEILLTQRDGRAYHRVIKASDGMAEDAAGITGISHYKVQLPTAVATVRGTALVTDVNGPISVASGTVLLLSGVDQALLQKAAASLGGNGTIYVKQLEKDQWMLWNLALDKEYLENLADEIRKRGAEQGVDVSAIIKVLEGEVPGNETPAADDAPVFDDPNDDCEPQQLYDPEVFVDDKFHPGDQDVERRKDCRDEVQDDDDDDTHKKKPEPEPPREEPPCDSCECQECPPEPCEGEQCYQYSQPQ